MFDPEDVEDLDRSVVKNSVYSSIMYNGKLKLLRAYVVEVPTLECSVDDIQTWLYVVLAWKRNEVLLNYLKYWTY